MQNLKAGKKRSPKKRKSVPPVADVKVPPAWKGDDNAHEAWRKIMGG
jgi:hypothetical protein